MDESKLVKLLLQKDANAQKAIYNKYVAAIYAYANRYVSDYQDAEEITTDVFLKIFEKIHQFEARTPGGLWNWVKKIALNECLMKLRKQQRNIHYADESVSEADWKDDSMDALSGLSVREIQNAIVALPDGYRTVFNLYVMESLSHKEISQVLQISEQTSKSQLFKAKKALKSMLQDKI